MRPSFAVFVPSTASALCALLLSLGCSPRLANGGNADTGGPKPQPATAQPANPPQFTEVPEADWTVEKPLVGRQMRCENGKIMVFACRDVDLLSFLPRSAIGGGSLNDIWGWTDPGTGREFVLAARSKGTSFVEITDPVNPRYLGELPFHQEARPSGWRGVKVYKNHAFIVSDVAGAHGMQVFDLTQLLNVKAPPETFRETAHYGRMNSSHNIAIDTATGFAFAVGSSYLIDTLLLGKDAHGETCGGGLHMIDVRNPVAPIFAGCYPETLAGTRQGGYVHDTQCVVYHGPDQRYRGREICFNFATMALGIVDVTDKTRPKGISVGRYPNVGYTHQGWLSEDQRYLFVGDEFDEKDAASNTRTIVFDVSDLEDPVVVKEFYGTTRATDHNLYVRGHYVYESNYAEGLRVLDVADPRNPTEVAYFDTNPEKDDAATIGSWSNYPYFKSGLIAVSSMNNGLFVLRHRSAGATR